MRRPTTSTIWATSSSSRTRTPRPREAGRRAATRRRHASRPSRRSTPSTSPPGPRSTRCWSPSWPAASTSTSGRTCCWSATPAPGSPTWPPPSPPRPARRATEVRFFRTTELVTALIEASDERTFLRFKAQLAKLDLLVLDELGYVPASKVGAELLFDVISTAYERTSLIVTSNLPFESLDRGPRLRAAHRGHARPAHPPLSDHRDQGRELPAQRRQGPGSVDEQGRQACGQVRHCDLGSDRSALVFDARALSDSMCVPHSALGSLSTATEKARRDAPGPRCVRTSRRSRVRRFVREAPGRQR